MSKAAVTKTKGNISEAKVLARLVELEYPVLIPWGDNERYDFVIEQDDGTFARVQVKTARWVEKRSVLAIQTCSSYNHCNRGKKSYRGEVDFIMAYSSLTNKVYKFKVDDVGKSEVSLRLDPPKKTGGTSASRFAEDYEL
jgi:hypothetical protein